jgi:hypothetical protein
MGWSYDELMALPVDVYDVLVSQLNDDARAADLARDRE